MNTTQNDYTLTDAFYRVNALNAEQRDAALDAARRRIAGSEPDAANAPTFEQFERSAIARFPAWVTRTITALCVVMLTAAFLPSAIRLHAVGLATTGITMTHEMSMYVIAICGVFIAETGQIVFSLAAKTNAETLSQRRGLWAGALVCTCFALTGNAVAVGTHATDNAFAFLETFAPPVLVLITAQILKTQMLHAIEARYSAKTAFKVALETWESQNKAARDAWQAAYTNAHADGTWDRTLANALRDALRSANRQSKAVLRELTPHDWHALVMRERNAEEWYDAVETDLAQRRARLERSVETSASALADDVVLPSGKRSTGTTGAMSASPVVQRGAAFFRACPTCGQEFEGATPRAATNSCVAHMKTHAHALEAQKQAEVNA